jgi:hypothetical protein
MKNFANLLLIILFAQELVACNNAEPEEYLIPHGLKGSVNIVFNQCQGENVRYENGRRVYEIPSNGVLLTKFKDQYGTIDHHYFYVDKTGKRTRLEIYEYQYNKDGTIKWIIEDPLKIGVFFDGTTGVYGGKGEMNFQEFLISDSSDLNIYKSSEYKRDFEKKLQRLLNDDFSPGTLTESEMDSIENRLNKKKVSN